jgi:RecA-family ATPase
MSPEQFENIDAIDGIPERLDEPPSIAPRENAESEYRKSAKPLATITPAAWKGAVRAEQRWLAGARIPLGDLTILSGDGGSGKTEIATGLLVSVAAGVRDWLGCVVETGLALFVSCEEPEENIRNRVERICKHRQLDPHGINDLHLLFPELDATWLGSADRAGHITKTPLLIQIEQWIERHKPRLIVIDSVAAVFDGEAVARRQVRAFLAILRKIARQHDVAILLLDHPSVRGMNDGTGTANSVDWRNSVRSMLHLSDSSKNDQDERMLEVKKSNYGRSGERVRLHWDGLTFSTAANTGPSPHKAKAEREIDELFLRLLDKRNAQGRPVRPNSGRGSAPNEMKTDPDANGVTAEAFRMAMERLFKTGKITTMETGPKSRRVKHIERAS